LDQTCALCACTLPTTGCVTLLDRTFKSTVCVCVCVCVWVGKEGAGWGGKRGGW